MKTNNELKKELNDVLDKIMKILMTTDINKVTIKKTFSIDLILSTNSITLDKLNNIINYTEKIFQKYPVSFRRIKALNDKILIIFSMYTDAIAYLTKYFYEIDISYNKDTKRIFIELHTDEVKDIDKINELCKLFEDYCINYINIYPNNDTIKITMYIML